MKPLTVGCIGCGNMGGAILKGFIPHTGLTLLGHDHSQSKVEALTADSAGRVSWRATPEALARDADIVILAVKPPQVEDMLRQIRAELTPGKVALSVATAVSLARLAAQVDGFCQVARLMPNLPAMVGKGLFALCLDAPSLLPEMKTVLEDLFCLQGKVLILPEDKFSAFSAVACCGPAFVCLFMEGMLNAAISLGFKADEAREMVAATVAGTAGMALDGLGSFADLRARVCSPGGTTIYGVNHLERTAVRGHIADAIVQSWHRDKELAKDEL